MKVIAAPFAFNEGIKIRNTLKKFPRERTYDLYVVDDGSTDGSLDGVEEEFNCTVLRSEVNRGIGFNIKRYLDYAIEKGYDVAVIVAGNDKDDPTQIPRLLKPIMEDEFDFVQGSRYLPGGDFGNMPLYRQIATRFVHPLLFSLVSRKRITDSTNGFRAIRLSILNDSKIDYHQTWLDKYELEPYLFYKSIRLGYKVGEVPVTKVYPDKQLGYTKMRPITGWWSILRPLVYLFFKIKK